jgi:hypothetical protein
MEYDGEATALSIVIYLSAGTSIESIGAYQRLRDIGISLETADAIAPDIEAWTPKKKEAFFLWAFDVPEREIETRTGVSRSTLRRMLLQLRSKHRLENGYAPGLRNIDRYYPEAGGKGKRALRGLNVVRRPTDKERKAWASRRDTPNKPEE